MKPFNMVVLGIFLALALGSVIVFATFSSSGGGAAVGKVTIWGSLPKLVMSDVLNALALGSREFDAVQYEFYPEEELVPKLIEAIAKGAPPDLVLFPADELVRHADKLFSIPYTSLSRRNFQDTFIQAAEAFLEKDGFKGIPVFVDPLVMYWNRSLFQGAGIARAPKYWDELTDAVPQLTKRDDRGGITQSTAALGTWDNIENAKGIFLSILYQLGNPAVVKDDDEFKSVFASRSISDASSADSALRFYSGFADSAGPSYSWNRARPNSREAFLAGSVAVYFGRTSELSALREGNPNLNFDVAALPVIRGGVEGTHAVVQALSVPRGAANPTGALAVAQAISGATLQQKLIGLIHTPSVRRDTIAASPEDPYIAVFNHASLTAFSFLDPDPEATDATFRRMVEDILSGKLRIAEAVRSADAELSALLRVQ